MYKQTGDRKNFWGWVLFVAVVVVVLAAVSWWLKVELVEWLQIMIGTVIGIVAVLVDSSRAVKG
jgi:uncharacterized membrane protein YhaH (DUF805 family)